MSEIVKKAGNIKDYALRSLVSDTVAKFERHLKSAVKNKKVSEAQATSAMSHFGGIIDELSTIPAKPDTVEERIPN